jgi:GT2 family glycosyltransferase
MKEGLLVAIPARDMMPVATTKALCATTKAGYDVVFALGGGLPNARNELLRAAHGQGYRHVLMVDSDMVFTPEHVAELYDHVKRYAWMIASARYYSRSTPHHPHAYRDGKAILGDVAKGVSERVDYTGAGFLLLDTRLAEVLSEPWFDHSHKQGEDAYFCHKAARLGVETRYYPYVTVGHVGVTMYSDPQFEAVLKRER